MAGFVVTVGTFFIFYLVMDCFNVTSYAFPLTGFEVALRAFEVPDFIMNRFDVL